MSTDIYTKPILNVGSYFQTVGSIARSSITLNGANHQCFKWTIQNIEYYASSEKQLKSPIFTVPNKNDCKWYLTLQFVYEGTQKTFIVSCLHLVLDRTSDCKEAIVKFKLSTLGSISEKDHLCNLQSGRTFKFVTNLENKAGILSLIPKEKFGKLIYNNRIYEFSSTIVCEIMIETTFGEDDSLSNDLGSLLKNQSFTDLIVSVGEQKFFVHKGILASRSSVFAAMFAHNMTEKEGIVHIKDMRENVVEEMLRYIYTGKVEKLEDLAQDLLIAADKYCLEGLRILCENMLGANLSGSNALDLLVFAKRYNSKGLQSQVVNFIFSKGTKLEKTEAWKSLDASDFDVLKVLCEGFLDFSN